jgi:S1-C subfamily serine protease
MPLLPSLKKIESYLVSLRFQFFVSLGILFVCLVISGAANLIYESFHRIGKFETAVLDGPLHSSSRELSLEEIEHTLSNVVVLIKSQPAGKWYNQGSAVTIEPYRLLSVCHIGKDNMLALVQLTPVHLSLVAERSAYDQCLFEADRPMPHVVPGVRRVSSLVSHEPLYAFGYPSGTPTLSIGKFTDVVMDETGVRMIRTNALTAPGNSGGGLFDRFGNLIGIMRANDTGNASFAVPIETWWKLL